LYGCEAGSVTSNGEKRLRISENRAWTPMRKGGLGICPTVNLCGEIKKKKIKAEERKEI
jgi:hypothetical protein